jgi:uncharacterized protein (DUF697 family)/tellurite resistance protein
MTESEQKAVLTVALLAAFADDRNSPRERAEIQGVFDALPGAGGLNLRALYRDVLLERPSLESVVAALPTPELRQWAFETAVAVCDADGGHSEVEKEFLDRLGAAFGISAATVDAVEREAATLAHAALPVAAAPAPSTSAAAGTDRAELDSMVLNYAILNGALELLPESLASMAIIPLQMKLVYRVGKAHGYELDRDHVRDLLATLGVGLTSQFLEQFGRKLLGGLLGAVGGKAGRAVGRQAASSAMSFGTTYALGQVAIAYYGGGRKLDPAALKAAFSELISRGRELQGRYAGEIEAKAKTVDAQQLLALVRGQ